MIYVVLGMHKSGTTLLARALHESGIPMGQDFPSGVEYAKAKYEARWVQEINDEILGVDRKELSLRVTSKLLPENGISESVKEKMVSGIREAEALYTDWGFKDPRTALTYGYWKEHLPEHRLVIIYRSPAEVWKRYASVSRVSRFRLPFKGWCDYNKAILNHVKGTHKGQYTFLNFEQLLTSRKEWDRLCNFVDVDLSDVRDPSQSINRISNGGHALPYKILERFLGREAMRVYLQMETLRQKSDEFILHGKN